MTESELEWGASLSTSTQDKMLLEGAHTQMLYSFLPQYPEVHGLNQKVAWNGTTQHSPAEEFALGGFGFSQAGADGADGLVAVRQESGVTTGRLSFPMEAPT